MIKYSPYKIIIINIISFSAFLLAKILLLSCRKEIIKPKEVEDYENSGKPLIYVFWHGRLFPMGFLRPKKREVYAVISRHLDGEMITKILSLAGVKSVRGSADRAKAGGKTSKNRGGSKVIRESINALEAGKTIAITPDGPRGPRFYFKRNFINVAALTKTPMVLVSYSASSCFVFKSWDRFILPKPFSKIKIKSSSLHFIPAIENDEQTENYGKELENILNSMTQELDNEFNIRLD